MGETFIQVKASGRENDKSQKYPIKFHPINILSVG